MKMISLGLSDNEIYKIMRRTDANNDGVINYLEFAAKFREDAAYDAQMKQRANNRLATLKEQMIQYMTSTTEAFRFVSIPFLHFHSDLAFSIIVRLQRRRPPVIPGFRQTRQRASKTLQHRGTLL